MSPVRLRTVDAFTETAFSGNPAAVVMLDQVPSDDWMAAVARETNLSDTGFVIREAMPDADFRLRWFTPTVEAELCGHATLASAHCLFEDGVQGPIRFATRSGVLTVSRRGDGSLAMDFPAWPPEAVDMRAAAGEALGTPVEWTGRSANGLFLLALLASEQVVQELAPNLTAVTGLDAHAVIATAPAETSHPYDFVSRVFAPKDGINEDPVTGSSHTVLGPYWGKRLNRASMLGRQVSTRSGLVGVELRDERVVVMGRAVTVFDGVFAATASPE